MAKFTDLDKLLQQFAGSTVPGCGCVVAQNGEILYEGYYGLADIETGKPVTADTVYRLYSMTKVITCTAALILFERGKFSLNEPYHKYYPEFENTRVAETLPNGGIKIRPAKNPILIRDAFNMAVGLPYADGNSYTEHELRRVLNELDSKGKFTLQDQVRAFSTVPIRYDPGSHWSYGYGHELVAALIEAVSGMTMGEFLKKEIFEPLEMENTGYRFFGDIQDRLIKMYKPDGEGRFVEIPGRDDENFLPDARYEAGGIGLFSTARDYTKFTQMLANGGVYEGRQIIGRKTIDLMRRNMLNDAQMKDFADSYNEGYGYGLGVRTMVEPAGVANLSVGEFGWTGAAGTWASIDPSEGVSVVYMHQTMPNNEQYHHHRVRAAAYGCIK